MSNGSDSAAGLEPADSSRSNDPGRRDALRILDAAALALEVEHENTAAEAVRDACCRIRALSQAGTAREGLRGSEGVHGEDSPQAEVTPARRVQTLVCPVCRTCHDLPLCPA